MTAKTDCHNIQNHTWSHVHQHCHIIHESRSHVHQTCFTFAGHVFLFALYIRLPDNGVHVGPLPSGRTQDLERSCVSTIAAAHELTSSGNTCNIRSTPNKNWHPQRKFFFYGEQTPRRNI